MRPHEQDVLLQRCERDVAGSYSVSSEAERSQGPGRGCGLAMKGPACPALPLYYHTDVVAWSLRPWD